MTMLNPCDLEIVTGGVLDNDYIDYLTRVMFYAKWLYRCSEMAAPLISNSAHRSVVICK